MRRSLMSVLGMFLVIVLGCSHSSPVRIVTNDRGERVALGFWSGEELLNAFPQFKKNFLSYQPDSLLLDRLKKLTEDVRVLTILGTWCSDSRREVPRFLKILDELQNPHYRAQFLCVDRSKKDQEGLAEKYGIELVPTFIFLRGEDELGRIIESPQISLEEDMVSILAEVLPQPQN